ncbi:hypothetical protein [Thiohalophilus thiocyanatoxydans]|uniref:Uncharacterized protein n=1 Tax=Thiohalophilus thiocyanatoxydans TaxID=381308 RepID=A0A4R8IJZ4_9GAMM|nr:hypothetical protein [Thiohalophilus thiocyanatoxydans]TDY01062.1 hypothetical protein EDC23_1808 [Thiohalophilus thiocyanatoxydans]
MEGISDIAIVGIDENRPPRLLKGPYINLYFRLSHAAPKAWCDDFNQLMAKKTYAAKIKPDVGLFIETWVRKPEEVEPSLEELKKTVKLCSERYIKRIEAELNAAGHDHGSLDDEGEQGRLNRIVAGLNFDTPEK